MKLPIIPTIIALLTATVSFAQDATENVTVYPTVEAYNLAKSKNESLRASDNSKQLMTGEYEITLTMPENTTVSIVLDYPGPDKTVKKGAKNGEKYLVSIESRKIDGQGAPFFGCRGIYFGEPSGFTKPTAIVITYKKVN